MANPDSWQPAASIEVIKLRAALYQKIRDFMRQRDILEVDTPVLSHHGSTDPYIQSLHAVSSMATEKQTTLYLHTSPEFCMKRLLAAGSESIYQIAHVFRDEESGKRHITEFSMLEWYRTGFDYYQLMDEVAELLINLGLPVPDRMTYADAFKKALQLNPHTVGLDELRGIANQHGWKTDSDDRHELLDFVFSSVVLKRVLSEKPLIIHDYPECMAALSTIKPGSQPISERFELFIGGMEIANGFNELIDAGEQRARFEADLVKRRSVMMDEPSIDEHFLSALNAGLPKCAGVALGLDRLLMVLSKTDNINKVSTFTLANN